MTISTMRNDAIDDAPCRYNGSRLWFRGPQRSLRRPYVACIGGGLTYGRYISDPFPKLLDRRVSPQVINLGVENGSVDAYLNDPGTLLTLSRARIVVIQLSDSQNTSNRFYAVHPRRNDRFLKASPVLRSLYPEMDFTEVHFTRHLLSRLHAICPERFELVIREVRDAWQARVRALLRHVTGAVILLWAAPTSLSVNRYGTAQLDLFLDASTLEGLRPHVGRVVHVVSAEDWEREKSHVLLPEGERGRLRQMAGPVFHRHVAERLWQPIDGLLK